MSTIIIFSYLISADTYILDVTSLNTIADFVLNNPDATSLKCLQYLSARSHEIEREKAEKIEKQFFLTKLNHEVINNQYFINIETTYFLLSVRNTSIASIIKHLLYSYIL